MKRVSGSQWPLIICLIALIFIDTTPAQSGATGALQLGIGDRHSSLINGRRVTWYRQAAADGLNFKYFQMWLTRDWQPQWVGGSASLRRMADDGYTPVLVYYFFGDPISKEYVESNLAAWYADCERVNRLADIGREVLIVLEPEFNKKPHRGTPIYQWRGWNQAVAGAIERLRGSSDKIRIGLCPGDFGEFNLEHCMREAAPLTDFVAFQEMRGSTHPHARSRAYRDVPNSALRYSQYLQRTFNLPVMLAYLAVSTYPESNGTDWSAIQTEVLAGVLNRLSDFEQRGVFSIIYMAYYDDPQHDPSFFGEAEKHFGLRDSSGAAKPAWRLWQEAGWQLAQARARHQTVIR